MINIKRLASSFKNNKDKVEAEIQKNLRFS